MGRRFLSSPSPFPSSPRRVGSFFASVHLDPQVYAAVPRDHHKPDVTGVADLWREGMGHNCVEIFVSGEHLEVRKYHKASLRIKTISFCKVLFWPNDCPRLTGKSQTYDHCDVTVLTSSPQPLSLVRKCHLTKHSLKEDFA